MMKKFLALLPILLMVGMFTFTADSQEESNQETPQSAVPKMMVDPGGW
ncbi:Uncharacterized protein BC88300_03155 [Bacillus cytotoxicus]|nr:Uncharacterized protein BC88300_03155 [Bacillus cytotoxicus]